MGNTSQKLQKLLETKAAIKAAIIDKGVEVGEDTKFADYPAKISAIQTGSGEGGTDEFFNVRTLNGTNLSSLFENFQGTELDVSNFCTSKTTDLTNAFYSCTNLQSLTGLNTWDTTNVFNMSQLFSGCSKLTTIDLSSFDMSKIQNTSVMFAYCDNLEEVDIRNFDMTEVTYAYGMFAECPKLHTLHLDKCNNATISKIITSEEFPTGAIDGVTRKIYVNPNSLINPDNPEEKLTPPTNWKFYDCTTETEIV